jgi:hypothetical protein
MGRKTKSTEGIQEQCLALEPAHRTPSCGTPRCEPGEHSPALHKHKHEQDRMHGKTRATKQPANTSGAQRTHVCRPQATLQHAPGHWHLANNQIRATVVCVCVCVRLRVCEASEHSRNTTNPSHEQWEHQQRDVNQFQCLESDGRWLIKLSEIAVLIQ